ncbi:MAG: SRPBCC domain-containing protein [Lutibacter sp.]|nr:SRPBCC domain-containing protein [Lutibacter sp.]
MNHTNEIIIVEQSFNVSLSELWNTIPNVEDMRQLFFNNSTDFKPEIGFKTEFPVKSGKRIFTHIWQIVEPFKKLVYNWKYLEYPGNSFVCFELFKQKNSSLLKVTLKKF